MAETETLTLPVLPLTSGVVGPTMVVNIVLDTPEARTAIDVARRHTGRLLLVPRIDGRYAEVGTVAKIEDIGEMPGGRRAVVVRGLERAVIGAAVAGADEGLWLSVQPVGDVAPTERATELAREYRAVIEAILEHRGAGHLAEGLRGITDPGSVADTALYLPELDLERKIEVLEALDVEARLEKVLAWAKDVLVDVTVRSEVDRGVAEDIDKSQREAVLRRQLEAIRAELGEGDGDVVGQYRDRLEASGAPDAVRDAVERELEKLERTGPQSPEHGWILSWLDTVLELPWASRAEDPLDLAAARAVLDADHAGLDDVKERIVELLAVRKLRSERALATTMSASGRGSGAILALVGPPGVGKTSLGQSVARAMGRPFARVALGGVRDEAEIRGHRRTYVGARPGRFVRALTEAGAMNPVLLLDEVDKVGNDWRGDPSSALLEVLDPAQNHTFRDHYLEIDLDLSDVVFLATANVLDTIPGPLLDRMEIVRLDGYTDEEKVAIARDHLLPRLLERSGLRPGEVEVADDALAEVASGYTREAGVRELERQLDRVLRKVATRVAGSVTAGDDASGTEPAVATVVVDADGVRPLLGRRRFHSEVAERTSVAGVATGLAVTGAGGEVLFVEATSMAGEPGLSLTGQLGDVMKESAEIARSFVRSHAEELGLGSEAFDGRRFHLHVPAGAVPKDGPSAGVAMTTALVSLLTGRPVRHQVGMTGEVTLQGKVLPIGGVKQKVLAAHRAGLTEVVLPARNEADLDDVPEAVREAITVHLTSDVRQVLALALEPAVPAPAVPAADEIRDGSFAEEWIAESRGGRQRFNELRQKGASHQIEQVGEQLRAMMPFVSGGRQRVQDASGG
ncbi:MAG: endopeptidase La [Actinobacteria bacterium]|nr:endopeptidase La [Actinomycetota bacterium]